MNKVNWFDLRNHNYARIACVSPTIHLGEPQENAEEHLKLFQEVYSHGAQVAVATECGMTGYTVWDLVNQQILMQKQEAAIRYIAENTCEMNILLVFGAYLDQGQSRYNVAIVMLRGKILAIIPKSYLASNGEFRDERWITSGLNIKNRNVNYAGQKGIPFGTDILISANDIPDFILTVQVCQDLWVSIPPSTLAALAGATVSATINASPEIVDKEDYVLNLLKKLSGVNYMAMAYCSSGVGESSTDLVFGGRMIIAQNDNILTSIDRFKVGAQYTIADIDLHASVHDRRNDPSFQQAIKEYEREYRFISFDGALGTDNTVVYHYLVNHHLDTLPFVPKTLEWAQRIIDMQVSATIRRLQALPEESHKLIIGVSGGADSAHALMIAANVMDFMELPRTNIIAITMPGFGTAEETYELAVNLMQELGVTIREVDIKELANLAMSLTGHDGETQDLTYENSQAWARAYVEWMAASFDKGLVFGTGDLSELILGWCTYAGDQMSHYNANANLAKTAIWFMLESQAKMLERSHPRLAKILMAIRNLLPTPELLKNTNKTGIVQSSEDKVGKYLLQDFFIFHMLRWGDSPSRLARKIYEAYDHEISLEDIRKHLNILVRRFLPNQFKRSTLPDGVLVGTIGVSPRDKLKIPSDASNKIWLEDIESIPLSV